MTAITPQLQADDTTQNIYFSPEKVNFSALIQAAEYNAPERQSAPIQTGFVLGDAPFISRTAFDRSYHRFSAFMAAPPHKPSFADPEEEVVFTTGESVSKINLDTVQS